MSQDRQPSHPSAQRWIGRLALAAILGIALALGIDVVRAGGPGAWLARRGVPPPYVALGERVDIGGRAIYIDCRGEGSPTIVLDAGMGTGAEGWSTVHDDLAAMSRTCAYDRPGLGRSDPRGTHTLADTAADLRAALQSAGEAPPFVLVGHSHGGDYVRVFTGRYHDEVAGIVLLDTFDPDLQTDWVNPLVGGALEPEYEAGLDSLRALVADVEHLDWPESERQMRDASLVGTSIEVLRAPRGEPRLDAATNEALARAVIAAYDSLSPGRVRFEVAWGAGHLIQFDRPDLVIAATRRLVDAARAGSR